jgi:hypothetical protein
MWTDNSDNETGFNIYRNSALIASIAPNRTSYQDTNLVAGTNYLYDVRAFNEVGEAGTSCSVTTPIQIQIPTAPTNLVGHATLYTTISLNWNDNATNEKRYDIYRNGVLLASIAHNSTSFQDANLQPSTLYYYDVRAVNEAGESVASCSVYTPTLPLNIAFNGWWVGGAQVNPAPQAFEVTAYVTLTGGSPGVYTMVIIRDISSSVDQVVSQKSFAYGGSEQMLEMIFLPPYPTNVLSTNGYHIDIYKDGVSIWSMVNTYPPRLRVY